MVSARYRAEMDRRNRIQNNRGRNKSRLIEGAVFEDFDPCEVFERDEWYCQLCATEVGRAMRYPDPMSATLDHVKPIAHGGDHTLANSQLSHLVCNVRKRDRWAPTETV